MTLSRFLLLSLLVGGFALSGCSLTPSMPAPEAEQELPDRFEAAPGDTTLPAAATDTARYNPTRWWTAYGDPALTALVDTALAANLDLSVARARLVRDCAASSSSRARATPRSKLAARAVSTRAVRAGSPDAVHPRVGL